MVNVARNNKRKAARAKRAAPAKVNNSQVKREKSGLGSQYDFGTEQTPTFAMLSPYAQFTLAVTLFETSWEARKIVNIPVDDIFREGWDYEGEITDEQRKALQASDSHFGILESMRQAARLERLIGGAALFMGVSDTEDPSVPLIPANVKRGMLKFVNPIPRSRIGQVTVNNDPLSAQYGRPEHYTINGQQVHRSRLILFKGDPLLPSADASLGVGTLALQRNDGFGYSRLLTIYDDITRAVGARQAAYQLVSRASIIIAQLDAIDMSGSNAAEAAVEKMREIVNQINLFRGAVLQRTPGDAADPITTLNPSFGSVPELMISFIQVLAAASDIPATRFLGQAPGGLNSTGESDLENYYGRLESEQRLMLTPQIKQYLAVQGRSTLGEAFDPSQVEVTFSPLWSLSELEQAQVRTADATTLSALVTMNLLSDQEALNEAKQRDLITSEVTDITPRAPNDVDEPPAPPLADSLRALLGTGDDGNTA